MTIVVLFFGVKITSQDRWSHIKLDEVSMQISTALGKLEQSGIS